MRKHLEQRHGPGVAEKLFLLNSPKMKCVRMRYKGTSPIPKHFPSPEFRWFSIKGALIEEDFSMPPACDELTFRLYVPNTFQKNQGFSPQSRARLLKIFDFCTGDAIVRNDEVVGSIPTSSTISNHLRAQPLRSCFTISQR